MPDYLQTLHDAYVRLTGYNVRFCFHERSWYEFSKAGFTESDLITVIDFLKHQNKKKDFKYSLRISKLIEDLPRFDELRAEATAVMRNRKPPTPTPKQEVQEAWHPTAEEPTPPPNVVPMKDLLKRAVRNL